MPKNFTVGTPGSIGRAPSRDGWGTRVQIPPSTIILIRTYLLGKNCIQRNSENISANVKNSICTLKF